MERVELLILPVRGGIDRSSPGITITTQLFRLAEGLGQQHPALTIGVGTNTFGQLYPFARCSRASRSRSELIRSNTLRLTSRADRCP